MRNCDVPNVTCSSVYRNPPNARFGTYSHTNYHFLTCPVTEHLLVCFRFLEICIAKPGQTGHKLQVLPACPISELRQKVTEKYNVEPQCQLLVHEGQVLVDEHPDSKTNTKVKDYIVKEDHTSKYFVQDEIVHFF